jgi:mono/diheme cytochrome c family protein
MIAFVARTVLTLSLIVALSACERQMADMYDQPKLKPLQPSPLWADGRASRPLPPDTIPYSAGWIASTSSGRLQREPTPANGSAGTTPSANPLPVTQALLERGRERYNIYCAPCHGFAGHGDGMVAQRGFPHPPSYHIDRLRQAPDSYFFDVMTRGYGDMYSYADRVNPNDRWAIVAYIRALQLSQNASLNDVPATERAQLDQHGGGRP